MSYADTTGKIGSLSTGSRRGRIMLMGKYHEGILRTPKPTAYVRLWRYRSAFSFHKVEGGRCSLRPDAASTPIRRDRPNGAVSRNAGMA
jgi:hypothetical protein